MVHPLKACKQTGIFHIVLVFRKMLMMEQKKTSDPLERMMPEMPENIKDKLDFESTPRLQRVLMRWHKEDFLMIKLHYLN